MLAYCVTYKQLQLKEHQVRSVCETLAFDYHLQGRPKHKLSLHRSSPNRALLPGSTHPSSPRPRPAAAAAATATSTAEELLSVAADVGSRLDKCNHTLTVGDTVPSRHGGRGRVARCDGRKIPRLADMVRQSPSPDGGEGNATKADMPLDTPATPYLRIAAPCHASDHSWLIAYSTSGARVGPRICSRRTGLVRV